VTSSANENNHAAAAASCWRFYGGFDAFGHSQPQHGFMVGSEYLATASSTGNENLLMEEDQQQQQLKACKMAAIADEEELFLLGRAMEDHHGSSSSQQLIGLVNMVCAFTFYYEIWDNNWMVML
jgi:hypothetical protein